MLAEKGLKETKSTNEAGEKLCPVTSLPYVEEDVIVLHQHLHDAEKQAEEHKKKRLDSAVFRLQMLQCPTYNPDNPEKSLFAAFADPKQLERGGIRIGLCLF